ncbi:hypothetical protein [Actinophytocola sediminis]
MTPFALVSAQDRRLIFAFGMDIDLPSGREVITFRREASGKSTFGVYGSAEAARRRFSMITPLELVWEPGCRCCLCVAEEESCGRDGTCANNTFPRI